MPLYEFRDKDISTVAPTTFRDVGLRERRDIQRLLRERIDIIIPNTMIIAEEFGEWQESKRRIDLLGIDKNANLVVIELKRTEEGGWSELQALRYAAMVSTMTFDQAADVFGRYLQAQGKVEQDPRAVLLDFLEWDEPDQERFAPDVLIVLASAEFSKELTSSVLWLTDHDINIRCIRLKPYNLDGRVLVDVQQIVPLPEATEYQVQVREKARKERQAGGTSIDFTRYDIQLEGDMYPSMWKRNAIFLICKRLCDKSTNPDDIAKLFTWRPNSVWYSVDGIVDGPTFQKLASERAAADGSRFEPRRWFCDEEDLVHANERTYAFSNQWGGENWHRGMDLLKEHFSKFKIEFAPSS